MSPDGAGRTNIPCIFIPVHEDLLSVSTSARNTGCDSDDDVPWLRAHPRNWVIGRGEAGTWRVDDR